MAFYQVQAAVKLHMGRGEVVFRTVIMNDQVMDTIHAGAGKNAFLNFPVNFLVWSSAKDGVHRIFHDTVSRPQNEKGHETAHNTIDLDAEEIFRQCGHQYAAGGKSVG